MSRFKGLTYVALIALALAGAACSDDDGGNPPKTDGGGTNQDQGFVPTELTCSGDCTDFVFNRLLLPTTTTEANQYAVDFDGDGKTDNALGNIITLLGSVGGSLDVQPSVDESVWGGSALVLLRLKAADLSNQSQAIGQAWLAQAETCCSDPTALETCKTEAEASCFKGDYSLTPDSTSPSDALFGGAITGGKLALGPGTLRIKLPIAGSTPIELSLKAVQLKANVTASGMTDGVLAGVIDKNDLDNSVIPSLATLLTEMLTTGSADAKAFISGTFDANSDGTITPAELSENDLIATLLGGDVDVDKDGTTELSLGIGFTAVSATINDSM